MKQSIEDMNQEEQKVYSILYDQCHRIIGDKDLPRHDEEFEAMVSMCSMNNMLNKLMELYPDPGGAVCVLKELIRKQWVVETRDRHGYPAFVPLTHMAIEEVVVKRKRTPQEPRRS